MVVLSGPRSASARRSFIPGSSPVRRPRSIRMNSQRCADVAGMGAGVESAEADRGLRYARPDQAGEAELRDASPPLEAVLGIADFRRQHRAPLRALRGGECVRYILAVSLNPVSTTRGNFRWSSGKFGVASRVSDLRIEEAFVRSWHRRARRVFAIGVMEARGGAPGAGRTGAQTQGDAVNYCGMTRDGAALQERPPRP